MNKNNNTSDCSLYEHVETKRINVIDLHQKHRSFSSHMCAHFKSLLADNWIMLTFIFIEKLPISSANEYSWLLMWNHIHTFQQNISIKFPIILDMFLCLSVRFVAVQNFNVVRICDLVEFIGKMTKNSPNWHLKINTNWSGSCEKMRVFMLTIREKDQYEKPTGVKFPS